MKHSELAQAIHLVDYGLKSPASGYLPGYHRSTTRATAGKLAGFTFEGNWFEVSTPKNYELAIKKWKG